MTKSARLTEDEVRAAMRAVGECRDVGRDPAAWNLRVSTFFLERLRSVFTSCFTLRMAGPEPCVEQVLYTFWADNRLHARWAKFVADHGYRKYPSVRRFGERYAGTGMTVRRQDLIPDREWAGSAERADRRAVAQDELLISAQPHDRGLVHVFSVNRADGDAPFTARDVTLVRMVHDELGRLFGAPLSVRLESQALPADLTPRLQAVLVCLLSGDGDKQVAARLGLSVHTVHEYVTGLFRRFGVRGRAELFALAHRSNWVSEPAKPGA